MVGRVGGVAYRTGGAVELRIVPLQRESNPNAAQWSTKLQKKELVYTLYRLATNHQVGANGAPRGEKATFKSV